MTKDELFSLRSKAIDKKIYTVAKQKWDSISKPLDGLGDFENQIARILSINENLDIEKLKKALVIMCGDHGVVSEGVSQCGQEVTLSVARLLGENKSTASKMAAYAGCDVITVDVGINYTEEIAGVRNHKVKQGTNNFINDQAMAEEEAIKAIQVGINIAMECKQNDYTLIAAGEMGIGNTTSGTALLCGLTGIEVEKVIGRGAGLSDEGLVRKKAAIKEALNKHLLNSYEASKEYTLNAISKVGGLEIAAMTGVFIGGAIYGIPVLIDGLLSAVAALCAERIIPGCADYMIASHAGREKGTKFVLDILGLNPLLNGNMALGEGTGALMAMPLLDMALDFYRNATTFNEGKITQYIRMDNK